MGPRRGTESASGELASLLRRRRAELQPHDVGLPEGSRRRTPGLRREEVAGLASISPTYYALLERGVASGPSTQVIDALANALRMSDAERAYIHALTFTSPSQSEREDQEVLAAGVSDLVTALDPRPAYVTGRRWDVLAANRSARILWTDWDAIPIDDRNMVWWTFTSPEARRVLPDWEHEAAVLLGRFRAASVDHLGDPGFTALIERLRRASPEARDWWPDHRVDPIGGGFKRLHHPEVGDLRFTHVVLRVADAPDQKLVVFTPVPDDADLVAQVLA